MIIQKSFYADLVISKHFLLLSVLKTVVTLISIFLNGSVDTLYVGLFEKSTPLRCLLSCWWRITPKWEQTVMWAEIG